MRLLLAAFAAFAMMFAPVAAQDLCPANSQDTLATLLSVVQAQRNSQAALTARVRSKMSELGLATGGPVGGRRLSEAVSLNLGADYVSELGSGGAWADQRLTKSEIAADPEAAALATYFRQTTSDQLGVAASDVQVVSIDTSGKRSHGPDGEMQEVQINYLLSDGALARSA